MGADITRVRRFGRGFLDGGFGAVSRTAGGDAGGLGDRGNREPGITCLDAWCAVLAALGREGALIV